MIINTTGGEANRDIINERFANLAHAVILQAVEDYRDALYAEDEGQVKALTRFFDSEWADFLYPNCAALVKALPDKVAKFKNRVIKLTAKEQEKEHACKCPICGGWVDIWFGRKKIPRWDDYKYQWMIACEDCGITAKVPCNDEETRNRFFKEGKYIGIRGKPKRKGREKKKK